MIDPMHNLFLGTSKYIVKNVWLGGDNPLIDKKQFTTIQDRVDNCIIPSTMGRIPHKIASSFVSFTADQWKSWTSVFSLYALHEIISDDHLECWRFFVQACHVLTTPMISMEDVEEGHKLLQDFCTKFENIYGSHKVTPNMHLHMHLVDCIKDYGPVYSFWLFSFERYNGLLGNFRTNQRSVELQLMRRFLTDLQIHDLELPDEHVSRDDLEFLLPTSAAGTLGEVSSLHSTEYHRLPDFPVKLWSFNDIYQLGGVKSFELLQESDLGKCYEVMYPGSESCRSSLSLAVYKYSQFKLANELFGSQCTRSKRSSYVLAR